VPVANPSPSAGTQRDDTLDLRTSPGDAVLAVCGSETVWGAGDHCWHPVWLLLSCHLFTCRLWLS
jgi:hypothetical protein